MDISQEYSERFDKLRKNRVETSFYKYGSADQNFGNGNVQTIPTLELCLQKYKDTGNVVFLCDIANYAMFEFMYMQHPRAHFGYRWEETKGFVLMDEHKWNEAVQGE